MATFQTWQHGRTINRTIKRHYSTSNLTLKGRAIFTSLWLVHKSTQMELLAKYYQLIYHNGRAYEYVLNAYLCLVVSTHLAIHTSPLCLLWSVVSTGHVGGGGDTLGWRLLLQTGLTQFWFIKCNNIYLDIIPAIFLQIL